MHRDQLCSPGDKLCLVGSEFSKRRRPPTCSPSFQTWPESTSRAPNLLQETAVVTKKPRSPLGWKFDQLCLLRSGVSTAPSPGLLGSSKRRPARGGLGAAESKWGTETGSNGERQAVRGGQRACQGEARAAWRHLGRRDRGSCWWQQDAGDRGHSPCVWQPWGHTGERSWVCDCSSADISKQLTEPRPLPLPHQESRDPPGRGPETGVAEHRVTQASDRAAQSHGGCPSPHLPRGHLA